MNQCNSDIRYGLIRAFFYFLAVDGRVKVGFTKLSGLYTAGIIVLPLFQSAYTEVIFVIKQQFMKRCTINVGQFQFHLAGCISIYISFGQVLFTGTCRLNHLINSAIASF